MRPRVALPALVRLLLDDRRAERLIDAVLRGGTLVVGLIDAARECDEAGAEILLGFAPARNVAALRSAQR